MLDLELEVIEQMHTLLLLTSDQDEEGGLDNPGPGLGPGVSGGIPVLGVHSSDVAEGAAPRVRSRRASGQYSQPVKGLYKQFKDAKARLFSAVSKSRTLLLGGIS